MEVIAKIGWVVFIVLFLCTVALFLYGVVTYEEAENSAEVEQETSMQQVYIKDREKLEDILERGVPLNKVQHKLY